MGGPCLLVVDTEDETTAQTIKAPDCTDNFQVRPFEFEGVTWQSVEQCYQAMKYVDGDERREVVRKCKKNAVETDWDYGIRVWELGQCKPRTQHDFHERKVEIMYKINVAKYASNPDLQKQLLSTGDIMIIGAPSTSNWRVWNGLIQMQIRKEIRSGALGRDVLAGKDFEEALQEGMEKYTATGLV